MSAYFLQIPFFLNKHRLVVFVLGLGAQQTDAHFVLSAKKLEETVMFQTGPFLQVVHRFAQLVPRQRWNSQVRLEVSLAVRRQARETRLQGLELCLRAHITRCLPWTSVPCRWTHLPLLYLDWNLLRGHGHNGLGLEKETTSVLVRQVWLFIVQGVVIGSDRWNKGRLNLTIPPLNNSMF